MKLFTAVDRYIFRLVLMPMLGIFVLIGPVYLRQFAVINMDRCKAVYAIREFLVLAGISSSNQKVWRYYRIGP